MSRSSSHSDRIKQQILDLSAVDKKITEAQADLDSIREELMDNETWVRASFHVWLGRLNQLPEKSRRETLNMIWRELCHDFMDEKMIHLETGACDCPFCKDQNGRLLCDRCADQKRGCRNCQGK